MLRRGAADRSRAPGGHPAPGTVGINTGNAGTVLRRSGTSQRLMFICILSLPPWNPETLFDDMRFGTACVRKARKDVINL